MKEGTRLSEVDTGESVYISGIQGKGAFRQRIGEMGFIRGRKITVIKNAPLNDPIEFSILGYNVSLRRKEAAQIVVSDLQSVLVPNEQAHAGERIVSSNRADNGRTIRVALVGNPNSGKTTIFNYASRSREHVGNYTGVTVGSKTAAFKQGDTLFELTDLPGTYSLSAYSPEELFVRDFVIRQKPDVVINIVDVTNIERNLFLTTQLIDMNVRVVVALNMFDELVRNQDRFDYTSLGRMLGIPLIPTIGARGKGIHRLFQKVADVHAGKDIYQRSIKINYGFEVEHSIAQISEKISSTGSWVETPGLSERYVALALLNRDNTIENLIMPAERSKEVLKTVREEIGRIEQIMGDSIETVFTDARYGFIAGALKETWKTGKQDRRKMSESIDTLLTNRYLGFPVFLFFMWIMFSATFNLGAYPQNWIDNGVGLLGGFLNRIMSDGSLKHLLIDGIIGGVGGVIIFLPNILILFFFISLMEDTGYMARAAFITDKLMHKIGLHGKSFIPMIMGFGCNVPAVMATRTIENRNNRLLTMLINPFMSCSARLPVYILLIGAIFPGFQGTMLFGIYLTGILVAILAALLFKNTLFRSTEAPFVMELPPYRFPTIRSTLKHMWFKASQYLKKMGGIIMIASILIWALGHFPVPKAADGKAIPTTGVSENSYIGRVGRFIEPAIRPLGFDWSMGVCLLTGVAAKEIVVSTMGVIYHSENGNADLVKKIQNAKQFTPLATLSFLMFTLLYFPCIATITAIHSESGSWRWAVFSVLFSTGLAWIASFLLYQTGLLLM